MGEIGSERSWHFAASYDFRLLHIECGLRYASQTLLRLVDKLCKYTGDFDWVKGQASMVIMSPSPRRILRAEGFILFDHSTCR